MPKPSVTPLKSLKAWILQLPSVTQARHKLGGTKFLVNEVEFMHSHGVSSLDILLSREDQALVLKARLALPHKASVHAEAGWVSLRVENSQDLSNARRVIRLAYEKVTKNMEEAK